jgi:molecular chaperone DnaK
MKGEDAGKIKEKMEELKRVSQEIGRILYASFQHQEGTSGSERK